MTSTAIVWFRRDLRLADNPALHHARTAHERIVPVFLWDPDAEGHWQPGAASRWWLHHSLAELSRRLAGRGAPLVIRAGDSRQQLAALVAETGARAVYWNRCYEPSLVHRDRTLKRALRGDGVDARSFNGALLFEPWDLLRAGDQPYRVFTPLWKRMQHDWRPRPALPEPRRLQAPGELPGGVCLDSLELLPEIPWDRGLAAEWSPGELGARRRLEAFAADVAAYGELRDRPDRRGTSRLSPHLHFGEISPGSVVRALEPSGELPSGELPFGELPDGQGPLAHVRELAWRDFSHHLLVHFPETPDWPLQHKFEDFPWRHRADYGDDMAAWQQGRTGIPLVDAGMRELWHTGWMHNRVRMVVASFLTKNLLIPWQEGARWFWDTLVDADLANNTQGWQWTAGCGADAAPYFRVFNPLRQAERFDPDGAYVRRWCGDDHPHEPMVDLKATRRRALGAFAAMRGA